jgi:hypothetical protein
MKAIMNAEICRVVEETIDDFCIFFFKNPYVEYSEHGIHALFFHQLYENFNSNEIPRYGHYLNEQVCLIQKEYRMSGKCGGTKAAHWDVCVLKEPLESRNDTNIQIKSRPNSYDFLEINSIIEFGLKANLSHLNNDVDRLCHPECKARGKFIVHLERFSDSFSQRDFPLNSKNELPTKAQMIDLTKNNNVIIYYVRTNKNNKNDQRMWKFVNGNLTDLSNNVK